jgi:hypothetical protein
MAVTAAVLAAATAGAVTQPAFAAPTGLVVSASPTRSKAVGLDGVTLTGRRYISVVGYPAAKRVRFRLDGGSPVTRVAPFDYAPAAGRRAANGLDTTGLTDGRHTLTAMVTRSGGAVIARLAATFIVANDVPALPVRTPQAPSAPSPTSPAPTAAPPPMPQIVAPSAPVTHSPPPSPTSPLPPSSQPPGGHWTPSPGTTWQWQLSGSMDTTVDATVYDVDGFDTSAAQVAALHAQGRRVICYLSAGTWEDWRPDAASFPASVKGSANGWPGERWLDIRRIDLLAPILTARFQMCRDKGFDAVEPDNVDAYSNSSGFPLSATDQLSYNRWLADTAHSLGLSVGLKNDVDQVVSLQPSFDWALNEQCYQYGECGPYQSFVSAGKAVFVAEYEGDLSSVCPSAIASGYSAIMKRLSLDAWRQTC